ncbi:helix-turn-helix domain-containing protein [Rhizosphaericola mali]|uniref:Helix-turn-helix transcriptional regulator n=1 Tax=Rhizosphaericola mali TaxID=2545455 RepID=A0A5P2FY14_9BACT|nr:helix-turn-helix domain-containing protein [Rhizosphaericola mali]QES88434.1 helix-turn-helix transcriptional regulator [Rhizosphaericola mali]
METIKLDTVNNYSHFYNNTTLNPLINVVDLSKSNPHKSAKMTFEVYCIVLKQTKCGDLRYGNTYYDYQEGTLVFFAPGQVVEVVNTEPYQPFGMAICFHPDLLLHTSLAKQMNDYNFFSYNTNEALHLSEKEKILILDIFSKMQFELEQNIDKHSKKLITSHLELLLDYCTRFYDRQFITRENTNKGILAKFEEILNGYFHSEKPQNIGLPSVAFCADSLHISSNYFGDLIKKETGKSAQEYIQTKVIDVAKERIFSIDKSISEVAYDLGFKYPQHFTRLFKQRTGMTPNEYKHLN